MRTTFCWPLGWPLHTGFTVYLFRLISVSANSAVICRHLDNINFGGPVSSELFKAKMDLKDIGSQDVCQYSGSYVFFWSDLGIVKNFSLAENSKREEIGSHCYINITI